LWDELSREIGQVDLRTVCRRWHLGTINIQYWRCLVF
jgi:hypothetical protein